MSVKHLQPEELHFECCCLRGLPSDLIFSFSENHLREDVLIWSSAERYVSFQDFEETFPACSSHGGNPAMQTPADSLRFLKDVAPPMMSGGVLRLCDVAPSVTALSCVYPSATGASLGTLTSELYVSVKTKHKTGRALVRSLCVSTEKSPRQTGQGQYT